MPLRPQPQQCSYNPSKFPITVTEREWEGDDRDDEYELYRFIQSNKKKKKIYMKFENNSMSLLFLRIKTLIVSIFSILQRIRLLEIWKQFKVIVTSQFTQSNNK